MTICIDCDWCKSYGRANVTANQRASMHPRKNWYCEHPNALESVQKLKGIYGHTFIAFGDSSFASPPQIKTSPRWCPKRQR